MGHFLGNAHASHSAAAVLASAVTCTAGHQLVLLRLHSAIAACTGSSLQKELQSGHPEARPSAQLERLQLWQRQVPHGQQLEGNTCRCGHRVAAKRGVQKSPWRVVPTAACGCRGKAWSTGAAALIARHKQALQQAF